jgi:hypothetical protein
MISIKKLLTFIILLTSLSMNSQHIDLPELGLSFDIPKGWTGDQYEDYIILGHQTIPGLMILFQNQAKTAEELKEVAMAGIVDEGVNLKPKGEFILQSAERVQGDYEGTYQGTNVRAFAIGLINGLGSGMSIIILTSKEQFGDQHIEEASTLAASVKFSEVKDSKATTEWKQWLVGKKLKYLNSFFSSDADGGSSSISDTKIIRLFQNGEFDYYSSSLTSVTAGSTTPLSDSDPSGSAYVGGQEENIGTYKIYTDTKNSFLELNFKDGKIHEYELGTDSEKFTTLNGTRYYVVSLDHPD